MPKPKRVRSRTGTEHIARNAQREWKSAKRKNVRIVETLCGRHLEFTNTRARKSCRTCFRIDGKRNKS